MQKKNITIIENKARHFIKVNYGHKISPMAENEIFLAFIGAFGQGLEASLTLTREEIQELSALLRGYFEKRAQEIHTDPLREHFDALEKEESDISR